MSESTSPDRELQEVALFPIPNLVAFPGTTVPLHVFEPRYRQLVHDCQEHSRMVGICHTKKKIREAPKGQSPSEILSSNQATYQPQEIFSAGYCEIVEMTADGRLMAEIDIESRFAIVAEVQTLPYRIVSCRRIQDDPYNVEAAQVLQQKIAARLVELTASQNPQISSKLQNTRWKPDDFSFEIFQFLRLDPDLMQSLLESRSAEERLSAIWRVVGEGS